MLTTTKWRRAWTARRARRGFESPAGSTRFDVNWRAPMDDGTLDGELEQLGDQLQQAIAMEIARNNRAAARHEATVHTTTEVAMSQTITTSPRRRSKRLIAAAVVGGVVIAGATTAAAVSMLSSDTVARGLPGGAAVFP